MKIILLFIGLPLFVLFLIYDLGSVLGFIALPAQTAQARPAPHTHQQPIAPTIVSGAFALQGAPSVSASFIDGVLCAYSQVDTPHVSPACHTGQDLYRYGVTYHIDPVYPLAFFLHESTFGRYGIAARNLGLGNIRCTLGYSCVSGFRAYHSWSESYADWYSLMADYIAGRISGYPCTTVEQIIPVYAPSDDHNSPSDYIHAVTSSVTQWRKEAATQ
jgi:hypothetical protein